MRGLLLRVCEASTARLPAEWRDAARAEAAAIASTPELFRWTLGYVRLALSPSTARRRPRRRRR
jgi:hypothetical protein